MNSHNEDSWLKEYNEFFDSDGIPVPDNVTENLFTQMKSLLNPSAKLIFLKILSIHIITGFLSLSVCNQFGINPFNTSQSITTWMMAVGGHHLCMVGCGVFFIGLSLMISGYLLTIEEVNALKRTRYLQTFCLIVVSLASFIMVGAEVAISIAALWLLGGFIGGLVATETVWVLKRGQI
ncbi:MAG: hypothetical protein H7061_06480 [Bdellovibrionaceae bacterium]|nr:hypothetical protein [Bdellovibrio sp.]